MASFATVINSVFLPRVLPQEADAATYSGDFVRALRDSLAASAGSSAAAAGAAAVFDRWAAVAGLAVSGERLAAALASLRTGDVLPTYVAAQNAVVTVERAGATDGGSVVTLGFFQVAAPSAEVTGAPGDLAAIVPSVVLHAPAARVCEDPEFGHQLAALATAVYDEQYPRADKGRADLPERRDVVSPTYVTEWLAAATAGQAVPPADGVRVVKKVRDAVAWQQAATPWRRSGEWAAAKAVLHAWFVGRLGGDGGTTAYKTETLAMMAGLLERAAAAGAAVGDDLLTHMAAKVARRAAKLRLRLSTAPVGDRGGGGGSGAVIAGDGDAAAVAASEGSHHEAVLGRATAAVSAARARLDARAAAGVADFAAASRVDLRAAALTFESDTRLALTTAAPHLAVALGSPPRLEAAKPAMPVCQARSRGGVTAPSLAGFGDMAAADQAQALWDFEAWVTRLCLVDGLAVGSSPTVPEFGGALRAYLQAATDFYTRDAVGGSRRILTAYTLVAVMDGVAVAAHPLLADHAPGVDVAFLCQLLLPHAELLRQATAVEAYFQSRAASASGPALLASAIPTAASFGVCFAAADGGMRAAHREILEQIEADIATKHREVVAARKEHDHLLSQSFELSCDYVWTRRRGRQHDWNCGKCRLQKAAANLEVSLYEKRLPDDLVQQRAVVYDLLAPPALAHLADALFLVLSAVNGCQFSHFSNESTWSAHAELASWARPTGASVVLGSSTKPFRRSHYSSGRHPSNPLHDFIVPNGCNAVVCTLKANTHVYADMASGPTVVVSLELPAGVYRGLQWTVTGTEHNANEVLCRQAECPVELALSEFVAFGTLRAGHRLQLRNILCAVATRSLSFDRPAVGDLLAQALWQAGPPGDAAGPWRRDAHADGGARLFARELLRLAADWLAAAADNWAHHGALLVIVTLVGRALALAGDGDWAADAAAVLCDCRRVAAEWAGRVEAAIVALPADSPVAACGELRSRLVDVAATGALTFDVDPEHIDLVLATSEDAAQWLRAVARIHDNVLLSGGGGGAAAGGAVADRRGLLLRRVGRAALRLFPSLQQLLHGTTLSMFVAAHWADGGRGQIRGWAAYPPPAERWYHTKMDGLPGVPSTVLQMDVLRGAFLVDGAPVGRLPAGITGHRDYRQVFGGAVVEVQPASGCPGMYVSAQPRGGSHFSFALAPANRLVLVERRGDGAELSLFPARHLNGDLPHALVAEYSHWLCSDALLFRPVEVVSPGFGGSGVPAACPYVLNTRSRRLTNAAHDRVLVDVRGGSFGHLWGAALRRLANAPDVHLWKSVDGPSVTVELPRMGLHFDVVADAAGGSGIRLASRELPGFYVAAEQGFGALTGLRHGLLLAGDAPDVHETPRRRLIVPHGPLSDAATAGVAVDVGRLADPPFFVYELANRLRLLRPAAPSRTALLYLALLHARTAGAGVDPFTGLTGTEAALRLLQGGGAWSNAPPAPSDRTLLDDFKVVAPRRGYYPVHLRAMESTIFPAGLPTGLAAEALWWAAVALERDGSSLAFLFPGATVSRAPPTGRWELAAKAYWRGRDSVGPEARLTVATESRLGLTPPAVSRGALWRPFAPNNASVFDAVRALARADGGALTRPAPAATLLDDVEEVEGWGPALKAVSGLGTTVTVWRSVNGVVHWLGLYEFCRRVGTPSQVRYLLSLLVWRRQLSSGDAATLAVVAAAGARIFEPPPADDQVRDTADRRYRRSVVRKLIALWGLAADLSGVDSSDDEEVADARKKHKRAQEAAVDQLEAVARQAWPTAAVTFSGDASVRRTVDVDEAAAAVSERLDLWFRARELHLWLVDVDARVAQRRGYQPPPPPLRSFVADVGGAPVLPSTPRFVVDAAAMRLDARAARFVPFARRVFASGQLDAAFEVDTSALPPPPPPPPVPPFPVVLTSAPGETDGVVLRSRAALARSWDALRRLQAARSGTFEAGSTVPPPSRAWREQLRAALVARRVLCADQARTFWMAAEQGLSPSSAEEEALDAAGVWTRFTPAVLLPRLVGAPAPGDADGLSLLGAASVCWTLAERAERCLALLDGWPDEEPMLRRELANRGRHNWSPAERPEWLLLELEQGWLVREVQATVAERLLVPAKSAGITGGGGAGGSDRDGGVAAEQGEAAEFTAAANTVLQLNMGEGKTSVILPLLAATLADGVHLFRCTVLRSLYCTNADSLTAVLGGLLGRRVWAFPCRRDLRLGRDEASSLLSAYQRAAVERGAVVTLPEHRLSFQLMALERCVSGTRAAATGLRLVSEWLDSHARDVIDESDSILDVRYQLVYAMGDLQALGGGALRWQVIQAVLRLVRRHVGTLLAEFGPDAVEVSCDKGHEAGRGAAFPFVRLLDEAVYPRLCELLVDDVLDGRVPGLPLPLPPVLYDDEKILARALLLDSRVDQGAIGAALAAMPAGPARNTLLALRGLLSYEVLLVALQKRYRVNYGVRPSATHASSAVEWGATSGSRGPDRRLMAVPFRAKDVPATRAEFSHSCMALMLTQLAYYHSGLTNGQVNDCFARLLRLEVAAAEAEYDRWVAALAGDAAASLNIACPTVPPSVRTLAGVNLSDHVQRSVLYPLLRWNMAVIDFWLNQAVFPVEARVIPGRLSVSSWDLCRRRGGPVVGFSGTNETALLLPPTVAQRDLPALEHTSAMVVAALLRPENQRYKALPPVASGRDILAHLCGDGGEVRVLLDVGALMSELDNAGAAGAWLAAAPADTVDAAIYFDDANRRVVVDRRGAVAGLELSPFAARLHRCVTFLDEAHTRGTDFRFPAGTAAAVTLGRGMTKDRLVQAAARMRRLGQAVGGHRVEWVASAEVHAAITGGGGVGGTPSSPPGAAEVLLWALRDGSEAGIHTGFLQWTGRGLDRTRAVTAERVAGVGHRGAAADLDLLGRMHMQRDPMELSALYGHERRDVSVGASLRARSAALTVELTSAAPASAARTVDRSVTALTDVLAAHADAVVGGATRLEAVLDEEQERELEAELEEEREVVRPAPATARVPRLCAAVERLALAGGAVPEGSRDFCPLPAALTGTSFERLVEGGGWSRRVWATEEFVRVLADPARRVLDAYLRPPVWLLATATEVVLLHPHEAQGVLPAVRAGTGRARLLAFAPRTHPTQRCMALTPELALPLPSGGGGGGGRRSSPLRSCASPLLVQLSVFGGGRYFCCPAEAAAYSAFLGLAPRPHTPAVAAAAAVGTVGRDGFVAPAARAAVLPPAAAAACAFTASPVLAARALLSIRSGGVGLAAGHAVGVLDRGVAPTVYEAAPGEVEPAAAEGEGA